MQQSIPIPPTSHSHLRLIREEDSPVYDAAYQPTAKTAGGFAMLPVSLFELNDGTAIAVYAVLAKHANKEGVCWPSMKRLEQCLGWSDNRIRPALKALIDAGIVTVEKRQLHGMDQSNVYRLPANVQVSRGEAPVSCDGVLGIPSRGVGYPATGYELEPIELNTRELVTTPLPPKTKPKRKAPEYGESFAVFWSAYQHEGRSSKPESAQLWAALTPDEQAAAIAALPAFKAGSDWQRGYAPGDQVWLRGRRWEAPPTPVSTNGRPTLPAGVEWNQVEEWRARIKGNWSVTDEQRRIVEMIDQGALM